MAIGTPVSRGTATQPSFVTTLAVTVSSVTVGTHLFLLLGQTPGSLASVADNQSNTWQVDCTIATASRMGASIASCKVAAAPTTVTATMSEAGGIHAARVVEVSGLATTSWKDQTGTVNQDFVAGTTLSVSASGANTQADEIAFVAFGYTLSNAWTAGSGFTDLGIVTDSTLSLLPAYKILSGIETTTATGTVTTGGYAHGAIATYKMASAAAGSFVYNPQPLAHLRAR